MVIDRNILIDLDHVRPLDITRIHVADTKSVRLVLSIVKDGESVDLSGLSVKYDALIAGNLAEVNRSGSISDNKVIIPVTNNMTALAGLLEVDIRLIQGQEVLHTQTVSMEVSRAIVDGAAIIDLSGITIAQKFEEVETAINTAMENIADVRAMLPGIDTSTLSDDNSRVPSSPLAAELLDEKIDKVPNHPGMLPVLKNDGNIENSSKNFGDLVEQTDIDTSAISDDDTRVVSSRKIKNSLSGKADKVSGATNGHIATLNSNGNLTDSGYLPSHYLDVDMVDSVLSSSPNKIPTSNAVKNAIDAVPVHSHSNKSVLDGITSAKVSSWDGKEDPANKLASDDTETSDDTKYTSSGYVHTNFINKSAIDNSMPGSPSIARVPSTSLLASVTGDKVNIFTGSSAPTSVTGAKAGDLYIMSGMGSQLLYQCTAINGNTQTWRKVLTDNLVDTSSLQTGTSTVPSSGLVKLVTDSLQEDINAVQDFAEGKMYFLLNLTSTGHDYYKNIPEGQLFTYSGQLYYRTSYSTNDDMEAGVNCEMIATSVNNINVFTGSGEPSAVTGAKVGDIYIQHIDSSHNIIWMLSKIVSSNQKWVKNLSDRMIQTSGTGLSDSLIMSAKLTQTKIDSKQDTISDLSTIRTNASTGAGLASDVSANTSARHTHSNKSVLDGISAKKSDYQTLTVLDTSSYVTPSALIGTINNFHDGTKQDAYPDGTHGLIDSSTNKINSLYLPDAILGNLIFGGVIYEFVGSPSNPSYVYASLTDTAYAILSTSVSRTRASDPVDDNGDPAEHPYTIYPSTNANFNAQACSNMFFIWNLSPNDMNFDGQIYNQGDWIISLGSEWSKVDNTDMVTSVNGMVGAVTGLQEELSSSNKLNPEYINTNSSNRFVTDTEKAAWNGKQNAISDLSTIRSNASTGASLAGDVSANSSVRHSHSNKSVLDGISSLNISAWNNKQNQHITAAVTLAPSGWVNGAQSVNVSGVTANNTVIVSVSPESIAAGSISQVYCSAQGSGTLTFTYIGDTPTDAITVNIVIMG